MSKSSNYLKHLAAVQQVEALQPSEEDLILIKSNYLESLEKISSKDYEPQEEESGLLVNYFGNLAKNLKTFPIISFIINFLASEPQN